MSRMVVFQNMNNVSGRARNNFSLIKLRFTVQIIFRILRK